MTIGDVLGWIVAGLIVGGIARLLVPGRQPIGCMMTIVLGIVGAVVGGVLYNLIAHGRIAQGGEFAIGDAWPGWLFAILGGVLVLWVVEATAGRRRRQ
ncbi:MAG TPA: GlsB/YeaQ/YmgE family stress response membrane protein [Planctomycetaceae bacterium]|nr:GlsB/YeaQ/YmgE family stress response membrane protein [Planctomycetaceae bacterium]